MTLGAVVREMVRNPRRALTERWNWKAAIFSAMFRAALFLWTNLAAGWKAATGAMLVEFLYRSATSGFYGAITQAFSKAEPVWAATAAAVLLPGASHSVELAVHLLRGTPNIITSMIASVSFAVVSTLFNLYAMRHGALVVGAGGSSLASDLRRMPVLIGGFLAAVPLAITSKLAFRSGTGP
jgi:hypothetical protein